MNIDYATPAFNRIGFENDQIWSISDPYDYSTLIWPEGFGDKPTKVQLAEESAEWYYRKEVDEYKDRRRAGYPNLADQLDKIYHSGIDAWKADIKAVKDAHAKSTFDQAECDKRKKAARDSVS